MITLPLPPKPVQAQDAAMNEYLSRLIVWQEELVRLVESEFMRIERNYDSQRDTVSVPGASVADLTSSNPKFKPTKPSNGGTRLAYATDATGGAKLVYGDGSQWREVDGGAVVS